MKKTMPNDIENNVAKVLKFIGFFLGFCAFASGIYLGKQFGEYDELNWTITLAVWVVGVIDVALFYALAEIINLLDNARDYMRSVKTDTLYLKSIKENVDKITVSILDKNEK
jgi:cbb3-type cytochrome oxidase subunit 1